MQCGVADLKDAFAIRSLGSVLVKSDLIIAILDLFQEGNAMRNPPITASALEQHIEAESRRLDRNACDLLEILEDDFAERDVETSARVFCARRSYFEDGC